MVVLLVGATTVFAELQARWTASGTSPSGKNPRASGPCCARGCCPFFGLILGLAFMLMVSLVVGAATAALGNWVGSLLPASEILLYVINVLVSLAFTAVLFAMIFKLMPSTPVAWRDVWTGAAVTAVLFEVGKVLIGLYIGKSGITESFQAAGSLVVLLAWVYYAAQIFLLGAEFTKVYADAHGSPSAARATDATEQTAAAGISEARPNRRGSAGELTGPTSAPSLELLSTASRKSPPDLETTVVSTQLGVAAARVAYELVAIAGLHLVANSARRRKSRQERIRAAGSASGAAARRRPRKKPR